LIGTAYAPSHITGFFEIVEGDSELTTGSRGAGVCLEAGVTTTVKVNEASSSKIDVKINGKYSFAPVSIIVAEKMLSLARADYNVKIEHQVDVPIGAGFGSSGAGALSASLAMNEALGLGLDNKKAAQIAHAAEIECRTGLGTVLAEFEGGAVIRTRAGAPGIGAVSHFDCGDRKIVGAISFGELQTNNLLSDRTFRSLISKTGKSMIDEFLLAPTTENFLRVSREFAFRIGLVSPVAKAMIKEGEKRGLPCSVAMFGETVYSLVNEGSSQFLGELFENFASENSTIIFSHVSKGGARLC
jgi:pantoate kinase